MHNIHENFIINYFHLKTLNRVTEAVEIITVILNTIQL